MKGLRLFVVLAKEQVDCVMISADWAQQTV